MQKIRPVFSRPLLSALKENGYTHIYNFGIISEHDGDEDSETYLLIPMKANDPRIFYEEINNIVEEIGSNDVYDMADGDEFITFLLEMDTAEYEMYIQKNLL
jgi:hypothetical protein